MTAQRQAVSGEIEREQAYVSMLYARLDELREQTEGRLTGALADAGTNAQARLEREASHSRYADRAARLEAAENGLCFGRLDLRDGGHHYIGRIGLHDDSEDTDDRDPLLIDWRAPVARAFYVATPAHPGEVRRRRHIATRDRTVTGLDDEVLDADLLEGGAPAEDGLTGEAALLAAVRAGRTGRMGDIVATLQAEQDAIIRAGDRGVLVVQGGPGTGKTAVALHRAAYLLYTYPRLASGGVLVVGPNPTFLSYIGQVLPGLGETGVLLSTVGGLFPGVTPDRAESSETAEIKGRAEMAEVVAAAVRGHQAPDGEAIPISHAGETLWIDDELRGRAAGKARATGLPHNLARRVFFREVAAGLAKQAADATRRLADRIEEEMAEVLAAVDKSVAADLSAMDGAFPMRDELAPGEVPDADDEATLRRDLLADPDLHAAVEQLWPALTPQRLLEELYSAPSRIASAAPGLTSAERDLLVRSPGGWSPADVPLLDEAADLLGVDDIAERERARREHAAEIAYAEGVLDIVANAEPEEREGLSVRDVTDAELLATGQRDGVRGTVAERAAEDRTWAFGHVIVDEAQELSRMAWRMLMRRCPTRSMTLVGDVAQTGAAEGTTSWAEVMEPYVEDRFRLARLSVNYRTPAEIMELANGFADGDEAEAPRAVRESGEPPWRHAADDGLAHAGDGPAGSGDDPAHAGGGPAGGGDGLAGAVAEAVVAEDGSLGEGRIAVIAPAARVAELGAAVAARLGAERVSFTASPDLTARVVLLDVPRAKGLEFDSVLVVEPEAILAGSPRGRGDLYVALTRATRRLGILHTAGLPAELGAATVRDL